MNSMAGIYLSERTSATNSGVLGEDRRYLHTEASLGPEEFDFFDVKHDVGLTFNLREFKAVVSFAESLDGSLSVFFDTPGWFVGHESKVSD